MGHHHTPHGEDAHHHHHHHVEAPENITRAFLLGIVLNSVFVVTEVVAGIFTHSLSLLSDAGHNLGDVASLALALLANRFALRKASDTHTFGYKQSTVLVALLNAVILLLAMGAVAYEAILRLSHPEVVDAGPVAIVAGIGILINSATALLFLRGKDKDLNVKGAYLHMAGDALVSLGVVLSGIAILYTHWYWLDAAASLLIVVIIVYGTWSLLMESLRLSMNGVPLSVDIHKIRTFLSAQPGISSFHDLHVWALSTTENALTVHLVINEPVKEDQLYNHIREELKHHFNINHSTIQIEHDQSTFHCEQKC